MSSSTNNEGLPLGQGTPQTKGKTHLAGKAVSRIRKFAGVRQVGSSGGALACCEVATIAP